MPRTSLSIFVRSLVFLIVLSPGMPRATAQNAGATPPAVAAPEEIGPGKSWAIAPPAPRGKFNSVYVEEPYIAMTFDDGPHATLTPKLLDLLAARHIKATFFVIGQNAAEYPEIMRRIAREGHEIGNHSWSHPNLGKMSDENVRAQLRKTDDAIVRAVGVRPTLMRPPYGALTKTQERWIPVDMGQKIMLWDVDPYDWKRPGPAVVTNRILANTRPGSIVLAHDIHAQTIEAMPATLERLAGKGFKFVTVSELLRMALPEPVKALPAERAPNPGPPSDTPARSTSSSLTPPKG